MCAMDRRTFIRNATLAAAAAGLTPRALRAAAGESGSTRSRVIIVHGEDPAAMLSAGIEKLGGWKAFLSPGARVVLKPNVGWASTPEQGANTHPALVEAAIVGCLGAGAASVSIPENPCSPPERAFPMSGVADVAKRHNVRLYKPAPKDYRRVALPQGKILREADVVAELLDAGFLINMPAAKVHGGAQLTLCLKNWMGSILDRGVLHREGLHQGIADLGTLLRAHLNVVDATRILRTNGPRGPGELGFPHQVILSTDAVAADAYAATLFDRKPFDIPYIRIAHEMGVGCGDLDAVTQDHVRL